MKTIENLDLTAFNSYKVKASCKRGFFPCTEEDIIHFFKGRKSSYQVIGEGNNIIFSKEYYDEDFLILGSSFNDIQLIEKDKVFALSGATLKEVSTFALENGLTGLEHFYDIPSSIGGAIFMNAGAQNIEIKDVLEEVTIYNLELNKRIVKSVNDIDFGYRMSSFQDNQQVILSALFQLKPGRTAEIKKRMNEIKSKRWEKQPRSYPNAGSVFKRPKDFFVGQLIEELGLKGFRIGGAQISEKHGGFIINIGNATGNDIIKLIKYIEQEVKSKKGIKLELEQRII